MPGATFDRDAFADDMRREHRTIQQLNAPAIFAVVKQWANDYKSGNFDLRNEATCKLAFALVSSVRRHGDESTRDTLETLNFPYI